MSILTQSLDDVVCCMQSQHSVTVQWHVMGVINPGDAKLELVKALLTFRQANHFLLRQTLTLWMEVRYILLITLYFMPNAICTRDWFSVVLVELQYCTCICIVEVVCQ